MAGPILYNTLSRKKEPFTPLDGKRAKLYTCGPTVYNYAHIGNLRSYVFADILKRTLLYNKIPVLHVMNITDVGHLTSDADEGEDKMEKGAKREGKTVWEIAEEYTESFKDDIHKLHIIDPDTWCKATEHIKEQIEQIHQLEKKGLTYKTGDGIYFDTSKLEDYGAMARLKIDELRAGHRVDMADKKNPTDFALWKFSPKDEQRQMEWESPWGTGFPGWHIECSAMSMHYLGEQFDIHTGGIDHIQVHHTNEIAQAEGATGKKPWVKFWMHGEFLVLDKGKMAKSGENFIILQTLIDKGYDPLAYRYMCLTASYRQQLTFSWEALETAKHGYERIKTKIIDLKERQEEGNEDVTKYEEEFLKGINDDLNMPQALAALWDLLKDSKISPTARVKTAEHFDEVLGLGIKNMKVTTKTISFTADAVIAKKKEVEGVKITLLDEMPDEIEQLVIQRHKLKLEKNWPAADKIRDKIHEKGFVIDDKGERYAIRKQ